MKVKAEQLPELRFQTLAKKGYEFEIISNKAFFKGKTDKDPSFKPHRIAYYGIVFTLKGEGFHFIDFKRIPYKRGTIFFLSKDQVHGFEWNENRAAFLITFTEDFVEANLMGSKFFQSLGLFNYRLNNPVLQADETKLIELEELVLMMVEEHSNPEDSFSGEVIRSLLRVFLGKCERAWRLNQNEVEEHFYQGEFNRFKRLIENEILRTRQVSYYADKLGYSTKKLNRVTKAIVGLHAKGCIGQQFILEIKRFLINTSLSVKEISYKCNFEDPTNFVKFFKAQTGMTPLGFRRQFFKQIQ